MYDVEYTKQARKDLINVSKSHLNIKTHKMIDEIRVNPFHLNSSLEKITNDVEVYYARRINSKHRLVYQVCDKRLMIIVHRLWTHYDKMGRK